MRQTKSDLVDWFLHVIGTDVRFRGKDNFLGNLMHRIIRSSTVAFFELVQPSSAEKKVCSVGLELSNIFVGGDLEVQISLLLVA